MLLGLTLWQLLFLLEFLLKLISLFLLVSNRRKLRPLNFVLYVLAIIFLPFAGSIYVLILLKKIKGVRTLCLLLFLTLHAVLLGSCNKQEKLIDQPQLSSEELLAKSRIFVKYNLTESKLDVNTVDRTQGIQSYRELEMLLDSLHSNDLNTISSLKNSNDLVSKKAQNKKAVTASGPSTEWIGNTFVISALISPFGTNLEIHITFDQTTYKPVSVLSRMGGLTVVSDWEHRYGVAVWGVNPRVGTYRVNGVLKYIIPVYGTVITENRKITGEYDVIAGIGTFSWE